MKEDNKLFFVVHKHDATRLHYDFRLQIGNVMPSWVIPKGPTLDPLMKRLALPTTDHSLEYRKFEGVLPEGSYGAGPVMIWDEGYYLPEVEEVVKVSNVSKGEKKIRRLIEDFDKGQRVMKDGMKKGEIKFQLFGKKLKGSYAFIKTRGFGSPSASLRKRKDSWLMIKHNDEFVQKGYDANTDDMSAASGKTLRQIQDRN